MKLLIKFFIKFMSIPEVSKLFLEIAEYLAKQTEKFTWDDRAVELFRKWSRK